MLGGAGVMLMLGGFYVIYENKNRNGANHFTSFHGKTGLGLILCAIGASMAGGIFLHPDFGIDKTNKQIRFAHKSFSRVVMAGAWMTCVTGMYNMTRDPMSFALLVIPLLVFAPFTLV